MDSYKLTTRSQDALSAAVQSAATAGHPHVEPLHLLLALLAQTDGIARPLIQAAGGDPAAVAQHAQGLLGRLPAATGATVAAPGLSRPAISVVNAAAELAKSLGDDYVSTEHLSSVSRRTAAHRSPVCCRRRTRCCLRSKTSAAISGSARLTRRRHTK